ncbi:MAG: putative AAA+ superfamily ATPase [Neolewinella sp.]|jgi:predicted AAA+ superfamily ATPase
MIVRDIEEAIRSKVGRYPVITITGLRQSGKTTLIKTLFEGFPYFSLESPDTYAESSRDPRGMFAKHGHRIILDEVWQPPEPVQFGFS